MIDAKVEPTADAGILGPASENELARFHDDVYQRLTDWLARVEGVRAAGVRHLGADLADLSVSGERYRRLVDALLATPPGRSQAAADALVEINVELRHVAWHIRSATRRIDRLASDLYPDSGETDPAASDVEPR